MPPDVDELSLVDGTLLGVGDEMLFTFDPREGAEADTPARSGAAVIAVGDEALFVWGGLSLIPGTDISAGDVIRTHRFHADGAVWRP